MKKVSLKLLLGIACVILASVNAMADTIKIHGSSTVQNSFLKEAKSKIESASGHQLVVVPNGSGSGLSDLAQGKADMAMISSSLDSVATKLNQKTPGLIDLAAYKTHALKDVEAVFITHPSNSVSELSGDQIAQLLAGEIGNWSQVGGPDKPVLVVTMIPGDGVRSAVESKFLKKHGKAFADNSRSVRSANQAAKIVSQIPHAIGICGVATVHAGVKVVQTDAKVIQNLYFVSKGEPSASLKQVIETAQGL